MTLLLVAVLAALLAVSCASLRVARNSESSSSLQDSLITAYIRGEIEKGLLEFEQTIVEFYPPTAVVVESHPLEEAPAVEPDSAFVPYGGWRIEDKDNAPPPHNRNPTAGPVKSITLTKFHATSDKEVSVDSSTLAGTKAEEHAEEHREKEAEVNEPPTATKFNTTLKSIAWILGLLLVGYIVIRISIAKAKK